jgi:membrane-associated phospholipid phosphatase
MVYGGFLMALLTGYSRIYLAQHFPLDVGAGMITAVISVYLSLRIQQLFNKKQNMS